MNNTKNSAGTDASTQANSGPTTSPDAETNAGHIGDSRGSNRAITSPSVAAAAGLSQADTGPVASPDAETNAGRISDSRDPNHAGVETDFAGATGSAADLHTAANLSGAANSGTAADSGVSSLPDVGAEAGSRYLKPSRSTSVFNEIVAFLTRRGVSVWGSRVLHVRGRKTGEVRTVPVNLLTHDGVRYLVAPRGHTQWVRNLRAAGEGELHVGRRVERFVPSELADDVKPAILRAYLRRWKFEVGVFFDGIDANASDADLLRIAPGYPVFRITIAP